MLKKSLSAKGFVLSILLSSAPVNGEQDHDHGSEHADLEEIIVQATGCKMPIKRPRSLPESLRYFPEKLFG